MLLRLRVALTDERLDDFAAKLTQLFEPPGVLVGESVVVESDQAEEGHMKIPNRTHFLSRIHSEFVRAADGMACLATTAGQPDRHRVGIVITTIGHRDN